MNSTKYLITLLILTFLLNNCSTTAQELTEERRELIISGLHWSGNMVFQKNGPDETNVGIIKYRQEDFFNDVLSENDIQQSMELIQNTGTIKIAYDSTFKTTDLEFKADLIKKINTALHDQIKVKFLENNLLIGQDTLPLLNQNSSGALFGKIKNSTRLPRDFIDTVVVSGHVKYQLKFLSSYQQITLSKNDIGHQFQLDNNLYKLIEIFDNKVVLEHSNKYANLNMINFVGKEKAVSTKYCKEELERKREENEPYSCQGQYSTTQRTTLNSKVYDIFRKKPDINEEEFTKIATIEFLNTLKQSDRYSVLSNITPIGKKVIIYAPIYELREVLIDY